VAQIRTPDCIAISKQVPPRAKQWLRSAAYAKILSASASLDVTPKGGVAFMLQAVCGRGSGRPVS